MSKKREWQVDVEIMPKRGVNDPQGEAVHSGLKLLGFDSVSRVRVGKNITFTVSAPTSEEATSAATAMCEKLLANPVIEEFQLHVVEATEGVTA